jgi:hypothetical protein
MFGVEWLTSAESELTQIWLGARDRYAVTEAASRFDLVLRVDPASVGEFRDGDERIAFYDPLGVRFRVMPDQRRVLVTHVWRCR